MRKFILVCAALLVAAVLGLGAFFVYAANEVATGQMGMATITLPSGKAIWLRRQSYAHTSEHLYISASDDYCAPYSSWHDYKLPPSVTGDTKSPLIFSFVGDTILVHAPEELKFPWLSQSFKVEFQRLASSEYAAYAALSENASGLPTGWHRMDVPYGHNTCSM
jgi:hypothetical protein